MAVKTLGQYQAMIEDLTGLHCEVTPENEKEEDHSLERVCVSFENAELLYIPPPRDEKELQQWVPPHLHVNDEHFRDRLRVSRTLQERSSLLRDALKDMIVFAEEVQKQREKNSETNSQNSEAETIDLAEGISRMRGVVSQAVFSLTELSFLQLRSYVFRGRPEK